MSNRSFYFSGREGKGAYRLFTASQSTSFSRFSPTRDSRREPWERGCLSVEKRSEGVAKTRFVSIRLVSREGLNGVAAFTVNHWRLTVKF